MNYDASTLRPLAERAFTFLKEGTTIGLGSGRTAHAFVTYLGERVQAGFRITGVPTSGDTADLAASLGIPLTTLEEVEELDLTMDGADEVETATLNLIKGLGGALVREKIVAASGRRLIILVTPEKLVQKLGSRGVLPIEVVPFGLALCQRRLAGLGLPPTLRRKEGKPFVTDNGNFILDCKVPPLENVAALEQTLLSIPGVVGTGLFLGMAETVLAQDGNVVTEYQRTQRMAPATRW
jgi:ribose 5-phosphate isomerase A